MVNTTDFGKRIQKIMDHYAVSASSFADYMGVGRSSISHILSGRNKPSLDFVMKITEAYTDVDLQWLLYGKGAFPKSEESIIEQKEPIIESPTQPKTSTLLDTSDQDLFSQSDVPEKEISITESHIEQIPKTSVGDTTIDRIVIFYVDGTFSSYQMKKT